MNTYVYKDNAKGCYENGKWVAPTIFSCQADGICEADELFKSQTNQDPRKMPHIGCSITATS